MSAHPQSKDLSAQVPDIDALYRPTHDEISRQRLIGALRSHVRGDMVSTMQRDYEQKVAPAYEKAHGHAPQTGEEIEAAMRSNPGYRFYSSIRYNTQEMQYFSVFDPVERVVPEMIEVAREIAEQHPVGGTLRLAPDFEVPGYLNSMDVHLAPGCFHSEYQADDVAQGAMLAQGNRVSTGANPHRSTDTGIVGRSIAHWLAQKHPGFKPRRVLDIGTQSGKNLLPYMDVFPGVEAYGIDVSAPTLRYGHAKAEHLGRAVHFSQQNAERLSYEDGFFDLVVSSFFFHEIPLASTKRVLKECHRLLSSGGIMAHMELPPRNQCGAWENFWWDWDDQENNNEPFYIDFRSQDIGNLMEEAGFGADAQISAMAPSYGVANTDKYRKILHGEIPPPSHGNGGWFFFGAIKDAVRKQRHSPNQAMP